MFSGGWPIQICAVGLPQLGFEGDVTDLSVPETVASGAGSSMGAGVGGLTAVACDGGGTAGGMASLTGVGGATFSVGATRGGGPWAGCCSTGCVEARGFTRRSARR